MEAQPFVPRNVYLLSLTEYGFSSQKATVFGEFLTARAR